ncbi:heterokaryon incompatibility protein-domain-containing protein [Cadophora sp. MPI-SDFR-AT-0126]|nr:heterokaryon incompatibility protein-domain-containing protein [Leotiomycetes sp. MPI-SDFR-AT-0126]
MAKVDPGISENVQLGDRPIRSQSQSHLNPTSAFSNQLGDVQVEGTIRQLIYDSLDPDIGEFRLLVLLPSTDHTSQLECQLQQASSNDHESYEALSYVWGEPAFTASIKLNNISFRITPRLDEALRYLRYRDKPRVLWVDALCIDQGNNNERRYQVGLMRQIYSKCKSGIVWMGPDEGGALGRAMTLLTKMEGCDIESLGYQGNSRRYRGQGSASGPEVLYELTKDDWYAVKHLLVKNSIWKRVWIMQEISLAPKVLLTSEGRSLDWGIVESLLVMGRHHTDAYHFSFSHGTPNSITSSFSTAQVIKTQRELCRQNIDGAGSSLVDVLSRFRSTLAADPRDKVFGLLGLTSDDLGIIADYSKDVKTVFTDVAAKLINHDRNLDLICQSQWQSFGNPHRRQDLPSWVPDFTWPKSGKFLFAQRGIFIAGRPECPVPVQVDSSGNLLLRGHLISSISSDKDTFKVLMQDYHGIWSDPAEYETMMDWWEKAGFADKEYCPTGEDPFQAFWRTIAVDCRGPFGEPMARLSDEDIAAAQAALQTIRARAKQPRQSSDPDEILGRNDLSDLRCHRMITMMLKDWRFCLTDSKHFSMIPVGSEPGDTLVVLDGAKIPIVLRPVPGDDATKEKASFQVVGGAYIHGLMDGEANTSGLEERDFRIC